MIYRVVVDGNDVYVNGEDVALISPTLTNELNAAGSFEFTIPKNHRYYDTPQVLNSNVEVYEDDDMIWYGRVTEINIDFKNQKKVYCEGALGFLNDTIIKNKKYNGTGIRTVFREIISNHNGLVDEDRRKFVVGSLTIDDESLIKEYSYENSWSAISSLIKEFEGYLFVTKENGKNKIDWLKDLPYEGKQPIAFGINLLDITQKTIGSEFKTSIIPYGRVDGSEVTVESVNHGKYYIDSEATSTYGRILEAVNFGDVVDVQSLYNKGVKWLKENQFDLYSVEVDAAELHYIVENNRCFKENPIDGGLTAFKVGQTVHCVSYPHLIDRDFPLTKITLNLDTASKKITIGSAKGHYISSK